MEASRAIQGGKSASRLGAAGLALLIVLSALGATAGLWKLLSISWVAFAAMAGAALWAAQSAQRISAKRLTLAYGLCSGAMITSAAVFLIPEASAYHAFGGFGVAAGIITGYALHALSHQLTHARIPWNATVLELTAHSLGDGIILGLVYTTMPGLSLLLGLAIMSHKGPVGYAVARRLVQSGKSASLVVLPAAITGIAAISLGLIPIPASPVVNGLICGFATGVFLHIAMDFLPQCEAGGEIYEAAGLTEEDHHLLDRLRLYAVGSTICGGLVIFAAWLMV